MRKFLFLIVLLLGAPFAWASNPECEEQCNLDYWTCSDNCGPFGGALCEQQCVDTQNSCLAHCTTCPSTRDYTTTTPLGATATGRSGCYEDLYDFIGGQRYAEYFYRQRITTYRETTSCNGTKTTTVLSTYDNNFYCWVRDPIASCSPYALNFLRRCPL